MKMPSAEVLDVHVMLHEVEIEVHEVIVDLATKDVGEKEESDTEDKTASDRDAVKIILPIQKVQKEDQKKFPNLRKQVGRKKKKKDTKMVPEFFSWPIMRLSL